MKKSTILFIICAQIGCISHKSNTTINKAFPIKPMVVIDDKEDGWGADIKLSIVEVSENDSSKIYKALSSYHDKNLGVLIFIPKKETNTNGFGHGITLKSIGVESDNLLQELIKLYKLKASPGSKFVTAMPADFVDLGVFAKQIAGKVVGDNPNVAEYKLFFTTKEDEAELFLNVNLTDKWLELSEKDPEYRPLIIKALTR